MSIYFDVQYFGEANTNKGLQTREYKNQESMQEHYISCGN